MNALRVAARWRALAVLAVLALFLVESVLAAAVEAPPTIEVFVSEGCPHCEAAKAFVVELARERVGLHVSVVDVRRDPGALDRLNELSRQAGVLQPGVPAIYVGSELIVGFDAPATTGARVRAALNARQPVEAGAAPQCSISASASESSCAVVPSVEIPWRGRRVSVDQLGLPLFTVVIGVLDGFNPCSMWVLLLMISMLAPLADRRRMLAVAGTFVAVEGIAYYVFMAAWLNLFLLVGVSRVSEIAIALLAIVAGAINIKDFVAFGRGPSLSIPAAAKPGIYARLRAILRAEHLWPALVGTVVLAVLVQVVELLCTSGFPAIYTRILTLRQLDSASYHGYLLLYNLAYMFDDIVILGIGVLTLSQRRLQQSEGRWLKLAAGLAMLGLGFYLLAPGATGSFR